MKKNSDETAPHAADVVQEQRFPPVGRRGFLKGAAAIGAAGLGSSLIEARSATAAPAGGHLKVGVGGGATTDTLDIGTTGGAQNQTMIESIRSKLVDQETNGDIVPDLATEWGSGNGGRRWTFKLRKGAEFHNGKTVTPQDVIDSINVLDRPVIVAYVLIIVCLFVVINLLVDLLYSMLDPRVRLAEAKA